MKKHSRRITHTKKRPAHYSSSQLHADSEKEEPSTTFRWRGWRKQTSQQIEHNDDFILDARNSDHEMSDDQQNLTSENESVQFSSVHLFQIYIHKNTCLRLRK